MPSTISRPQVGDGQPAAAGEPFAGLGRRAVGAEGDVDARTAEALGLGLLPRRDAVHEHGDAARRDEHAQVGAPKSCGSRRASASRRSASPASSPSPPQLAQRPTRRTGTAALRSRSQSRVSRLTTRVSAVRPPDSVRSLYLEVEARDLARQVAHAGDVRRAVGDADHAARVEQVEGVAALEHVVVGRDRQPRLETALGLAVVLAEVPEEHLGVGDLEVVAARTRARSRGRRRRR